MEVNRTFPLWRQIWIEQVLTLAARPPFRHQYDPRRQVSGNGAKVDSA